MTRTERSTDQSPQDLYSEILDAGQRVFSDLVRAHHDAFGRTGWDQAVPYKDALELLGNRVVRQWTARLTNIIAIMEERLQHDQVPPAIQTLRRFDAVITDLLRPLVPKAYCVGLSSGKDGVQDPLFIHGPDWDNQQAALQYLEIAGQREVGRLYSFRVEVASGCTESSAGSRSRGRPRLDESTDSQGIARLSLYRVIQARMADYPSPKDLCRALNNEPDIRDLASQAGFGGRVTSDANRLSNKWGRYSAREKIPSR
jgi:hypothetical protein